MCVKYIILNNDVTGTLTEALANNHPEENLSLSDRFLKAMDASIKSVFAIEEQISGYLIFKSIEDSAPPKKSDADIKLLYIQWMCIKRTNN